MSSFSFSRPDDSESVEATSENSPDSSTSLCGKVPPRTRIIMTKASHDLLGEYAESYNADEESWRHSMALSQNQGVFRLPENKENRFGDIEPTNSRSVNANNS